MISHKVFRGRMDGFSFSLLNNTFPDFDFRKGNAEFVDAGQELFDVRALQVNIECRFARPVFVKQKLRGIVRRLMQIVIQTAGFLAGGRQQPKEHGAEFGFFAGARLKGGGDGDRGHGVKVKWVKSVTG
jgi:hypothetical protein